jgi:hypothetical protein
MRRRLVGLGLIAMLAVACAARKDAPPPMSPEPATGGMAQPQQQAAPGAAPNQYAQKPADVDAEAKQRPQGQPPAPPPPPPPSTQPTTPSASTTPSPSGNRSVALAQASNDIEVAQRELDVAGGDCRNACRALGSMDRAAGRICSLIQSNDDPRRCGDAKAKVYSARDKVKNTCGSCPETSVDRNAPVPSR